MSAAFVCLSMSMRFVYFRRFTVLFRCNVIYLYLRSALDRRSSGGKSVDKPKSCAVEETKAVASMRKGRGQGRPQKDGVAVGVDHGTQ